MAKKRMYEGYKSTPSRIMKPNNGIDASPVKEDWSQPALLPRGVKEVDVTFHANQNRAGRIGDKIAQVDKTTRADQMAFDNLTDPTNW